MPLLGRDKAVYAPLVVLALLVAGLYLGRELLVPLTVAAGITFILSPIVLWLVRHRFPRPLAILGVVLALVAASASIVLVLSGQLLSLTGDLARYEYNLVHKVRALVDAAKGDSAFQRATDALSRLEKDIGTELTRPEAPPPVQGVAAPEPAPPPATRMTAESISTGILAWLEAIAPAGLVILFAVFMLFQSEDIRDRLIRLIGIDNVSGTTAAFADAADRLSKLFLAQATVNLCFGGAIWGTLWLAGVPNSALWGALAFLGRFVPYVGGVLSGIPPVLFAAAVDPGWGMALTTAVVFTAGELTMSQIVEPLVLGRRAGLSPLAMLVSSGFWALIWGPVGLILAAPLTLTFVVLGRHFPGLEFLTVLLGDTPALSPSQQLYQRLLAGDSLAAIHQVEQATADGGAPSAGDAVILPALRLAAGDLDAGRIDKERAGQIAEAMREVTAHLTPPDTAAPPPEQARAVLVLPARGPLDAAAAEFVAHAIRTRLPGFVATALVQATGLSAISQAATLDSEVPDIVVIVCVGATEYLPLIARRAAAGLPGARIVALHIAAADVSLPSGASGYAGLADLIGDIGPAGTAMPPPRSPASAPVASTEPKSASRVALSPAPQEM